MSDRVREYLKANVNKAISWRTVLNNASTKRPKSLGGPINSPIAESIEITPPAVNSHYAQHKCVLTFDNSYEPDDGEGKKATGFGLNKESAIGDACLNMLVQLLAEHPDRVRLISTHWAVPLSELRQECGPVQGGGGGPASSSGFYPPPGEPLGRPSNYVAPEAGQEEAREADIVAVLRAACREATDGVAIPWALKGKKYLNLHTLLERGTLKNFIEKRLDFEIVEFPTTNRQGLPKWGFKEKPWQ